jgi:hypothetical protein
MGKNPNDSNSSRDEWRMPVPRTRRVDVVKNLSDEH